MGYRLYGAAGMLRRVDLLWMNSGAGDGLALRLA